MRRGDDADLLLSAALFGDGGDLSSLERAISPRRRAEERDRLAEEEFALASMVRGSVAPGGIVDEARRGADVYVDVGADVEEAMRREAAGRRRDRDLRRGASEDAVGGGGAAAAGNAPGPPVGVVPRSGPDPARARPSGKGSPGGGGGRLLTREREYELARTIQLGARAHRLRAEYESAHSAPIRRKEWARLAGMTTGELRKLVSDYRRAKGELVSRNVGLVRAVVRSRYARRAKHRGVPIDELIQEGSLGLIRAAELFDPSRGLRFSTYATIWIKGVLSNSNSLDEVISLPSREKAMYNKVRRAWGDMAMEAGVRGVGGAGGRPGPSSAEDLASRLGMEKSSVEGHLRRMACVTNVLSLDYRYSSSTRSGHASGAHDASLRNNARFGTDADLAERAQLRADVVSGLVKNLTERELTLMRLRYGLEDGNEYTLKECAERMGINRETARLLQHACLKKLREASNMESLQEYLLTVA
jgi:RNA polymerase nonessential primary-like sigma factor